MLWLLSVAPLALVYGFSRGYVSLRKGRRPIKVDESFMSWEEDPRSIFWQDPQVGLALTAHALFLLLIAVVGLKVSLTAWDTPLPVRLLSVRWLYFGALTLTVLYIWMAAGIALAFPMLSSRIGPVPIHLMNDGVLHGRVRVPWGKIGWVERIPASRGLRLRSRRNRKITLLSLMPPSEADLAQAETVIRNHLGKAPLDVELPRRELKSTFLQLLLGTVISIFLIGLVLSSFQWVWSFIYFSIGTYLATILGAQVIRYYYS